MPGGQYSNDILLGLPVEDIARGRRMGAVDRDPLDPHLADEDIDDPDGGPTHDRPPGESGSAPKIVAISSATVIPSGAPGVLFSAGRSPGTVPT